MSDGVVTQLAGGGLAIAIGLSGWLLPYRWNLLRPKRFLARFFSEQTNRMIPKVIGTVLMVMGVGIVVATAFLGSFE